MSPPSKDNGAICLPGWAAKGVDTVMVGLIASLAISGVAAAVRQAWLAVPVGVTGAGLLWLSWAQVRRSRSAPVQGGMVRGVVAPPPRWLIVSVRIVGAAVGLAGLALVIGGVWFATFGRGTLEGLMVVGSVAGILGMLMIREVLPLCGGWSAEVVTQALAAAFFLPSLYLVWLTVNAFPDEMWPLRVSAIVVALVCRQAFFYFVAFAVCRRLFPAGRIGP